MPVSRRCRDEGLGADPSVSYPGRGGVMVEDELEEAEESDDYEEIEACKNKLGFH